MSDTAPRAELRFVRLRSIEVILVALMFGAGALYGALDYAMHPDRVVYGRGYWLTLGHGAVGTMVFLAIVVGCIAVIAINGWRLYARLPAVALAKDGIWFDPTVSRRTFVAFADVAGVAVDRVWVGPSIFSQEVDRLTILIPGPSAMGRLHKPIKIGGRYIEGGVDALRAFADALEAARLAARA